MTAAGLGPLTKPLFVHGVVNRLQYIHGLSEERDLAEQIVAQHATAPALAMVRLGETGYMFALCSFKYSEEDAYCLSFTGPLDDFLEWQGRGVLRETIVDRHGVRQIICNDQDFIADMEKRLRPHLPVEYTYVDVKPDFGGREVIYK